MEALKVNLCEEEEMGQVDEGVTVSGFVQAVNVNQR